MSQPNNEGSGRTQVIKGLKDSELKDSELKDSELNN